MALQTTEDLLNNLISDLKVMRDMKMPEPARRWLETALAHAETPEMERGKCPGNCGKTVAAPDLWCSSCWPTTHNAHRDCRSSDHLICRKCGELLCVGGFSDHRADMYRLTPIHPSCR